MQLRKKDRASDNIPNIVRSDRFVETDEGWFFRTRENIMLGPYAEKFDAEISASLLVARLAQLEEGKDPAKVIHAFVTDPANATIVQTRSQAVSENDGRKTVNVRAIKRRQQLLAAKGTLKKAWSAISSVKSVTKNNPTAHP